MMWWVWEGTLSVQFDLAGTNHIAGFLEPGDIFISTFPKELGELLGLSTAHPIYDSPLVRARRRGVAMEKSQLVGVGLGLITDFARKHARWQTVVNISVLRLMTFHMNREYQFLTMNAEQRYLSFLEEFPRASSLISQRQAANYLGLTPVGLNRVVSRLRSEGRLDDPRGRRTPAGCQQGS